MYKLTLLLIPLILLSSCTIDWKAGKQGQEVTSIPTQSQKIDKGKCEESDINCKLAEICRATEDHNMMQSGSGDSSFNYSTIVKMGDTLFYFQNTDGFPFATSPEKMEQKKGYIYVFKEYNCLTNTEKELVSSGTMNKVLELLPQESSIYWPDISGFEAFTDTNFSFFGGVLRFVYIAGSAQGGYGAEYNITINTRAIDNATNGGGYVHADAILINGSRYDHGGNDPSKILYPFSTGAYFHKNETIIP